MFSSTLPADKPYGEDVRKGKVMPRPQTQAVFCSKADGYRGIWWGQTPTGDDYAFKYSGGLGTYPVQHSPFAIYRPEVKKTFFVWGGTTADALKQMPNRAKRWDFGPGELLHMISYYDHETGMVPRPTLIFDKWTADPHDNPVLSIDDEGYIWVFSPSHGQWTTPSFIHRSTEPYSIERFETIHEGLFAYPQPWWVLGKGLAFFHTQYSGGENDSQRGISFRSSPDGRSWNESRQIAHMMQGHYQVSAERDGVIATAFDIHPEVGGLEARTNIYYLESRDFGETWQTIEGVRVTLPITDPHHMCCIRDFLGEGKLVYIKDMIFDHEGHPVIHYLTSRGWKPGPEQGPHEWHLAHWTGSQWKFYFIARCDNNYDMGSLYLEAEDCWRIIGSSGKGPQPFNPGGEIEAWTSYDRGQTWLRDTVLTRDSLHNHTHSRRPLNAHPDFYAFWADGDGRKPSESHLYYANKDGKVFRLPNKMDSETAFSREI